MKLSVCVPHWKRQAALDRMFLTYAEWYGDLDLEFSVCDDGSPADPIVPPGTILTVLPKKHYPLNPCVPINRAVAASTGDVIVLTNPELGHRERVLPAMLDMMLDVNTYVTAECRDVDTFTPLAGPLVNYRTGGRLPVPPRAHFHFCAMFTRDLWNRAGGFDEEYRFGQACDDNDWLWRAYAAGAVFRECPATVWHTHSGLRWGLPLNHDLFDRKWPESRRLALLRQRGP